MLSVQGVKASPEVTAELEAGSVQASDGSGITISTLNDPSPTQL